MLPVKRETTAPAKSAFARALERFAGRQEERRRETRIGFIIDATGSRYPAWKQAQTIQARMFLSVSQVRALLLRLVHFGGGEISDHGWMDSPQAVADAMAGVTTQAGLTDYFPALERFLSDPAEEKAHALILIGDSFEEYVPWASYLANQLKAAGIKVYCFLEGQDATAETAFRDLAEITGGKFAKFGADLPLSDLCEGAALLAAGGEKAVKRLGNKRVQQLLLTGPSGK